MYFLLVLSGSAFAADHDQEKISNSKVVEAPDILYNETSNDTITMEGASVSLNCEARLANLSYTINQNLKLRKSTSKSVF